ncbi:hypothetical protein BS78_10G133800 [Paspalum vaginatum]|nr:hypothetical protein BS78_10G133800 [Paspalum vaginatum]
MPVKPAGSARSSACGNDSDTAPDLKIGGITIDKPKLVSGTIPGLEKGIARLMFGSVQISENFGDGVQQQQQQPGVSRRGGVVADKDRLYSGVDREKCLKETGAGLRTELAEGSTFTSKIARCQHRPRNLGGSKIMSVAPGTQPKPRWCPGGLTHTQKRRVQRLRALEIREEQAEKKRDEWFNQVRPMVPARMTWKEKRIAKEESRVTEDMV